MSNHNPNVFATEISHVSECAFERAIIRGEYSILDGKRVDWLDIEIPVAQSGKPRDRCIDLIGKDEDGRYVLCELKFRRRSADNGNPLEAAAQLNGYLESIKNHCKTLGQHLNALGDIGWEAVANGATRLVIAANHRYWDSWHGPRRQKGEYVPSAEFECYSVNVDQDLFAKQKGSNEKYTPNMPEEAKVWERR